MKEMLNVKTLGKFFSALLEVKGLKDTGQLAKIFDMPLSQLVRWQTSKLPINQKLIALLSQSIDLIQQEKNSLYKFDQTLLSLVAVAVQELKIESISMEDLIFLTVLKESLRDRPLNQELVTGALKARYNIN